MRWPHRFAALCALATGCETVQHAPPDQTVPAPTVSHYYGLKPKAPLSVNGGVVSVAHAEANPASAACNIDLATSLRLAGASNPTVALARERVQEALAEQLAAKSLLLPSVNVGANYRLHRGVLQGGTGIIRDPASQSVYVGAGANAVGGGTVGVPGVRLFAPLADAAFEPLAARQRLASVRSDSVAVQNTILRDVATAYLELVSAESRVDVLRQGQVELAEIVRLTAVYAAQGQGRASDAHRAEANAQLLTEDVRRAEEDAATAIARLCGLLNLDPTVTLRTPGGTVEPIRLISEETEPEGLIAQAVAARPELAARSAGVAEARTRERQERVRPWLPTVSVGYSYGLFGGGSDLVQSTFSPLAGRSDLDVAAVWAVENLGLGNLARVRRAGAGVGQAAADYDAALNEVRREVVESLAGAQAAARQIETAKFALATAQEGFALDRERIKLGQGRPIEVLDSFRQSLESRLELVRAVTAFNVNQFRLLAAVGRTPGG